jgi:hypothetical protein
VGNVETITALILVVVCLLLGLILFLVFFDPWTARLRPRYRGGGRRFLHWLATRGLRIVLILVAAGAVAFAGYGVVRYRHVIAEKAATAFSAVSSKVRETVASRPWARLRPRTARREKPAEAAAQGGTEAQIGTGAGVEAREELPAGSGVPSGAAVQAEQQPAQPAAAQPAASQATAAGGTPAAGPPAAVTAEAAEGPSFIADHASAQWVRLDRISLPSLEVVKWKLHILYVHGTHGSQITYGIKGLGRFKGPVFDGLDFRYIFIEDDATYPELSTWAERIRGYLEDPANQRINVMMWSWTDELSTATAAEVDSYLQQIQSLEKQYPRVQFVYMTGHVDGSGLRGNTHQRNEQIRAYCQANNKILYDFADIESYDPDGRYYGNKRVNDGCWYDSDGNGSLDRNWAKEWSDAHPGEWYDCYSAHSYPLNANLKAYAAWWLWARLAGWEESPR